MIIILFGPPGAGKGTQAELLQRNLGFQEISTGHLLRIAAERNTDFGRSIKVKLAMGHLVDDEIVIELLKEELAIVTSKDLILDGFPRTAAQAKGLEKAGIEIGKIIELVVSDNSLVDRITGRRVHLASGRVYHIKYAPPKQAGFDDLTGEPLIIRDDDTEEVLKKRLQIYYRETIPVLDWYKNSDYNVFSVNSEIDMLAIHNEIAKIVKA